MQMLPGEAEVPTPIGNRASRSLAGEGGSAIRSGRLSRDDGRREAGRGASILSEYKGERWRGVIVRLCLHPAMNESNDLVYCQPPEWVAGGEGGGMEVGGGRGGNIPLYYC